MNQPSSRSASSQRLSSPAHKPVIVWLRQDLRLSDHPALSAACQQADEVVLVYLLPERSAEHFPGEACCWWLHHSLQALQEQLQPHSQKIILRQGEPLRELLSVAAEVSAQGVFWNRCYEPAERAIEEQLIPGLEQAGLLVRTFPGSLLLEPEDLKTKTGGPFQVFTPFWRAALNQCRFADALPAPAKIPRLSSWPTSLALPELKLLPRLNWADGFSEMWSPGETGAQQKWQEFLTNTAKDYENTRNLPAVAGTSRLSPHLHFGEISPRQIWQEGQKVLQKAAGKNHSLDENLTCYLREIGWREFAYYILFHFPDTVTEPLRENFRAFPWERNRSWLKAWQTGQTGFPIVDAGMRELWHTGWMHNRVRMIVASFLTKDLFIHWREGARWFENTLVDADLASNTLGWQWTAGSGADAAPYFRIFNPVLQSQKFDPDGHYLRRWCPELQNLPAKYIHEPATAPREVLRFAGVKLGSTYPEPIVNHAQQRDLALKYWDEIKNV